MSACPRTCPRPLPRGARTPLLALPLLLGAAGETPGRPAATGPEVFPGEALFPPLLAAPREWRASAGFLALRVAEGRTGAAPSLRGLATGVVGFGGSADLWGWRAANGLDGVHVGLGGLVQSAFDLDGFSTPLINTDFVVGVPVSLRRGPLQGRVRLLHQSSHLGDEVVALDGDVRRIDLSFEALEVMVAVDGGWWRAYAGLGVVLHTTADLRPLAAQAGAELRGEAWTPAGFGGTRLAPVLAFDLASLERRGPRLTLSVRGGLEARPPGSRRWRLMLHGLHGPPPIGQLRLESDVRGLGLELQLEL